MNVLRSLSIHSLAVVTALNFMPVNAFAQSQSLADCSCLVPAGAAGQPIGSIVAVNGRVQVSGATGFSDSKVGTMLSGGSRVIVGPRSSASLSLGDKCPLQVSANQDVALDPVNAKICVRVLDQTTTADVELAPMKTTSAFANPFIVEDATRSGVVVSPPVPATAVRRDGNVPVPKSPTTTATTLDTARAVHAAPNDPVPANTGAAPNAGQPNTGQSNTAQNEDNDGNSVALVVLGLAGVGGIVALALSGGESSVSD
ncbi:MAG: hypothetical protein P1V21_00185 [Rhizobiaceae bacterium]|nr:hypothetical protein [Rhizobiaceae bacterium]